jgi:hypothetical protein
MSFDGVITIHPDPREPDWRFSVVSGERVLAEAYFDADRGWHEADHPHGWTLRYVPEGAWEDYGLEVPLAPNGHYLSWAHRDAAAQEAVRLLRARLEQSQLAA